MFKFFSWIGIIIVGTVGSSKVGRGKFMFHSTHVKIATNVKNFLAIGKGIYQKLNILWTVMDCIETEEEENWFQIS